MSSTTNVTITPLAGSQTLDLNAILGEQGWQRFEEKLRQLVATPDSGWSRVDEGAYRVALRRDVIPAGVRDLSVTVELFENLIDVRSRWTYVTRGDAPEEVREEVPVRTGERERSVRVPPPVREQVRKVVNRAVNEPLVNVVASGIKSRLEARMNQKIEEKVFAQTRNAVELHAMVRMGGVR